MVRNILIVVLLCVLGYAIWVTVKKHEEQTRLNDGNFTCQGCLEGDAKTRFDREDHGETADGNSEHKPTSARVAAEEAVSGTSSAAAPADAPAMQPPAQSTYGGPVAVPANTTATPPVVVPTTGQPTTSSGLAAPYTAGLPATDSVPANPVNGYKFSGSGAFQWYRQGNLTWRVDTATGRSCIVYATLEEWRKQIVMSHGCGRNA